MSTKLARLGIFSVRDLLFHWPRDWQDLTEPTPLRAARRDGFGAFAGTLHEVVVEGRKGKRRARVQATLRDADGGELAVVWYNQQYLAQSIRLGTQVVLVGTTRWNWSTRSLWLVSPRFEQSLGILPIYPETEGITSRFLRTIIRPLLPSLELDDPVEGAPIRLADAVREMHVPTTLDRLRVARERLTLDELRALHFRLHERRASERGTAPSIALRDERLRGLVRSLPFALTAGQRRAAWHLAQQLQNDTPMRQLLQGDVGSGKTVVALIAAHAALDAGYHVAWMAPTQLLARQLAARLAQMLDPVGGAVRLVTAGQSDSQPSGPTLFVGTQALLRHVRLGTQFGFVVVDEQHRFGVRDRDELIQPQRGVAPHVLTMSATPIPRSLALTLFGELGCTTLTERPIMQQPIRTKLGNERTRPQVAEVLRRAVVQGRQAFIVVPRIGRSEDGQLSLDDVLRAYQQLLPGVRFAPYHGQQSDEEQARVMDGYLSGRVDVLVATTIVEVGIDVPNAAVMVIEEADRFGLAQLHQLRGRVGRGAYPGVCIVLTRSTESQETERLRAFTSSTDGFALAELDLKLRGPGELLGSEQSGMPRLKLASLLDPELGRQAQETAIQWQQAPPATLAGFLELYSAPMH